MAVISQYELNGVNKTKNDDGTLISCFEINDKSYNFANRYELKGIGSVVCDNSVKEPIYDMKLYGNSVQNGTPTPTSPIKIESVGNKTRNLFDKNNYFDLEYYIAITSNGANLVATKGRSIYIMCEPNTTYTISKSVSTTMRVGTCIDFPDANVNLTTAISGAGKPLTIKSGENDKYMIIQLLVNSDYNNGYRREELINYLQVEKGDVATEYISSYEIPIKVNNTTTNIYLDAPLRKFDNYSDYIDYKNKKVIRNIGSVVLNNALTIVKGNGTYLFTAYTDILAKYVASITSVQSDTLIGQSAHYLFTRREATGFNLVAQSSEYNINLMINDYTTVDELKEYLKENPITVHYILKTPTEETIELPTIETFKGVTTIDVQTDLKPSETTVEYWRQVGAEKETYYKITFNDGVFVLIDNISIANNTKVPVGTSLVVGYTLTDGYKLTSFTVNGVETENNTTITVTGDIEIVFAEKEEMVVEEVLNDAGGYTLNITSTNYTEILNEQNGYMLEIGG